MQTFFNWETLYVVGAVLLALGIVYGLVSYYTRNRRNDALTEDATREQYDHATVDGARAASAHLKAKVDRR
jgi:hypothetical protein